MDIPVTRLLPCDHDPASIIIVATKSGRYLFRCPVCGAESRERVAPEWFWTALVNDSEEDNDGPAS